VFLQFQRLRERGESDARLRRLLDYVENSMLLVGESSRATSREVAGSLEELIQGDAERNVHAVRPESPIEAPSAFLVVSISVVLVGALGLKFLLYC